MEISVVFNLLDKSASAFGALGGKMTSLAQRIEKVQGGLWKVNQTAELLDKMGAATEQLTAPFIEFEKSMAELSAITGIAGSELTELGNRAREIGVASGLGATGAVDAFKLLASQIDVSKIGMDGLMELQTKTITLAQASGMSLTDAANSMAGTINQFGLEASEASRVINVLAAGSKYGAAEIPELAQSFKVVGAAANAAGLSVEQTAGAIEVLSKNNLKGSEAGTALRNIMLKMQTTLGVDFRKTSLSQALESLKPKLQDATYLSGLFGMENIAAAQFLIANSAAVDEMTARVTDTSVATEQAAITTSTWSHRLKIQKAQINDFFMSITESSQGVLSFIQVSSQLSSIFLSFAPLLSAATIGIKTLGSGFSTISNVAKATKALSAAMQVGDMMKYAETLKGFGAAGRIASAGLWLKTIAIKTLSFATTTALPAMIAMIAKTWAWTAALLANPITWVVIGIAALGAAVVVCWNKIAEFRAGVLTAWDVLKGFGTAIFEGITAPFRVAIETIGGAIKAIKALMEGDFSGAWDAVKESFTKSIDIAVKPYATVYNAASSIGGNYDKHLKDERAKEKATKTNNPKSTTAPLFNLFNPTTNDNPINPATPQSFTFSLPNPPTTTIAPPQPTFTIEGSTGKQPDFSTKPTQTNNIQAPTTTTNPTTNTTATVNIDYAPIINISSEMTQKSKDDLIGVLKSHAIELTRIVKEEMRKDDRTTYSYGIS